MLVTLTVGDWSNDGHGMTDVVAVESNKNIESILAAYKKGTEIVGFELHEQCRAYEDNSFPMKHYEKLMDLEVDLELEEEAEPDSSSIGLISGDDFAAIYIAICKLGDPEIQMDVVQLRNINIGGYGLFY